MSYQPSNKATALSLRPPTLGVLAMLVVTSCSVRNPNYGGETASSSESGVEVTGPSTSEGATTGETSTGEVTTTGTSVTTDPGTSGSTVDPSTTEDSDSEGSASTSSTTLDSSTGVTTDGDTTTGGLDCDEAPPDPLKLYVEHVPTMEEFVGNCMLPIPPALVQVAHAGDTMVLSQCLNEDCNNCPSESLLIDLTVPPGSEWLRPNPGNLPDGTCMILNMSPRKPAGGNMCTISGLILRDYETDKPRFIVIDEQTGSPVPELGFQPEPIELCPDCDGNCCDGEEPGRYKFVFAPNNFEGEPPVIYPADPPEEITFMNEPGFVQAHVGRVDLECKPKFELLLTTLEL